MMYIDLIIAGIYHDLSNARGIKVGSTHIKALLIDEWTKRLYSEVSEKSPLHGTKPENVESVYPGIGPETGEEAVLGPAVYMAESSSKADQYTGIHFF
ncbi:hypothetical protein DPMN_047168 [Dreissena polymorpha]|uniref:Uncharacterized protein n=1 Tax=Dreissena polymorpha TaxID=45954 RepID=A0A9D4D882_DREPO|nr:hypothetical protein DPMN_047168 [Dreissena polymorpha]